MNFDRIAHLVKLVFNTRVVVISLVDGTEEYVWFSSSMPQIGPDPCIGSSNLNVSIGYVTELQFISCIYSWMGNPEYA